MSLQSSDRADQRIPGRLQGGLMEHRVLGPGAAGHRRARRPDTSLTRSDHGPAPIMLIEKCITGSLLMLHCHRLCWDVVSVFTGLIDIERPRRC